MEGYTNQTFKKKPVKKYKDLKNDTDEERKERWNEDMRIKGKVKYKENYDKSNPQKWVLLSCKAFDMITDKRVPEADGKKINGIWQMPDKNDDGKWVFT